MNRFGKEMWFFAVLAHIWLARIVAFATVAPPIGELIVS